MAFWGNRVENFILVYLKFKKEVACHRYSNGNLASDCKICIHDLLSVAVLSSDDT
jgi:hypothetical protein